MKSEKGLHPDAVQSTRTWPLPPGVLPSVTSKVNVLPSGTENVNGVAVAPPVVSEMIEMVGAQWRNMIGWFVQYEEEKLRQQEASSGGPRE